MKDVKLTVFLGHDILSRLEEHRQLRDAVDAASVSGEITYLQNSAGARVAAIVPVEVASAGLAAIGGEVR